MNHAPDGSPVERWTCRLEVRWSDLDAHRHLRNTAYSEFATQARFRYLREHGFPPERFEEEGFGPVIFREELRYLRELFLADIVAVDFRVEGLAEDGSQFRLVHDLVRLGAPPTLAATVRVEGSWMDLRRRKLCRPAATVADLMRTAPRAEGFETLRSLVRDET